MRGGSCFLTPNFRQNWRIEALILLPCKGHIKRTINLENLNFFFRPHIPAGMTSLSDLAVSKLFAYLFKYAKLFTKPLTGEPQGILMKSFFVAIE